MTGLLTSPANTFPSPLNGLGISTGPTPRVAVNDIASANDVAPVRDPSAPASSQRTIADPNWLSNMANLVGSGGGDSGNSGTGPGGAGTGNVDSGVEMGSFGDFAGHAASGLSAISGPAGLAIGLGFANNGNLGNIGDALGFGGSGDFGNGPSAGTTSGGGDPGGLEGTGQGAGPAGGDFGTGPGAGTTSGGGDPGGLAGTGSVGGGGNSGIGSGDPGSGPNGGWDGGAGGGGGAGGECFTGSTPVLMADGTERPIAEIEPGDLVMSFIGLGPLFPAEVLFNIVTGRRRLIDIDGLLPTAPHPFILKNGTWKFARDVAPGDELVRGSGETHVVRRAEPGPVAKRVHNLEMDGPGDGFVAGGIRVRNSRILCLELYRQGLFTPEEMRIERAYSRRYNPYSSDDTLGPGYHRIARPLIAASRRSPLFARAIAAVIRPWIKELAHRHEGVPAGHIVGRFYIDVLVPLTRALCRQTGVAHAADAAH